MCNNISNTNRCKLRFSSITNCLTTHICAPEIYQKYADQFQILVGLYYEIIMTYCNAFDLSLKMVSIIIFTFTFASIQRPLLFDLNLLPVSRSQRSYWEKFTIGICPPPKVRHMLLSLDVLHFGELFILG